MRRFRGWAASNPGAIDVLIAALLAVLCLPIDGGQTVGRWLWWAGLCVPLVFRRRRPILAYWTILGLALIQQLTLPSPPGYPLLLLLTALYAVAAYTSRRDMWIALAGAEGALLISLGWPGRAPSYLNDLIATNLAGVLVTVLAIYVATRRVYLAGLVERAERVERESAQQAQLAAAAERARIAREMHDIVAHSLTVMVALADGAGYAVATSPTLAAETMEKVAATGRQALGEARRLVGVLHHDGRPAEPSRETATRAPQPGFDDIDGLIDRVRAAGVRVVYTHTGVPGAWGAGPGVTVYRLVQEALTNTLKHAGPDTTAHVALRYTADGVGLDVTDDGRATRQPAGDGHGLAGMVARATTYGGHVRAGPRDGGGWRVDAHLNFDPGASPT